MAIKRWVIHAPGSDQYEACAEGEWCEWDDVSAELMKLDGDLREAVRLLEDLIPIEFSIQQGWFKRRKAFLAKLSARG